jgi:hypothetical protein
LLWFIGLPPKDFTDHIIADGVAQLYAKLNIGDLSDLREVDYQ